MAQSIVDKFLKDSTDKISDLRQRDLFMNNLDKYNPAFEEGRSKFYNLSNSKKKANLVKWKVMENLDRYLVEFEANFIKRGGKVIWANDAEEARQEIGKILEQKAAKSVVKAKSMTTEEIELNEFLQKRGIEAIESELGNYFIRLLDQKPSHFVSPSMHLSLDDIAKTLHEELETPLEVSAEEIIQKVREVLRDKYKTADVGITGANFLIADTGSIAITENEGNARLVATFPKTHIVLAGIEKIIPTLADLDLFWPLLASHGTGQNLTAYNSIFSGTRQDNESDGPTEMYVILLDNGRTNLLAKKEQRQGLYCIRCGSCLNVCPVYQHIGGSTYNSTYPGPIGSLISPHLEGMKEFKHLSYASTLCGKCTEVCPVGIDIQKMLLLNRRDAVQENLTSTSEKRAWKSFAYLGQKRRLLDFFGGRAKSILARILFKKAWGSHRELPKFPNKSFSALWKAENKNRE